MTENAQIEEMAELVYPFVDGRACEQESGACELTACRDCNALNAARALYNAGYRKVERGEWVKTDTPLYEPFYYKCSVCGNVAHPSEIEWWNFCPDCGANVGGKET